MDLILILTGGDVTNHTRESKNYNLIEFDPLHRRIKLSELSTTVSDTNSEIVIDSYLQKNMVDKIRTGTSFLCKNEIYHNNKRCFNLGYYIISSDGKLEIKPLKDECKVIYNQFINLLIENCVYNN